MRIIGIDPGGAQTGIVVRESRTLIAHTTVFGDLLDPHYPGLVIARIELGVGDGAVIAMEDTTAPSYYIDGKAKPINLDGLRATERVVGAVLGRFSGVILVPPNRNGQGPLEAFPEPLRPTRGQGKGHDHLRHERSAYMIAEAGLMLAKLVSR